MCLYVAVKSGEIYRRIRTPPTGARERRRGDGLVEQRRRQIEQDGPP